MALPGLDERGGELAAGLDEERAGAHRGVADLQLEDLLGRGVLRALEPGRRRKRGA